MRESASDFAAEPAAATKAKDVIEGGECVSAGALRAWSVSEASRTS